MTGSIAGHYAAALAEIVFQPGSDLKAEDVIGQLKSVEDLIAGSPELRSILMTPAVPISRKRAVIGKLAAELGVSHVLTNFLFVLIGHKRIMQLSACRAAFEELVDQQLGFVRAQVTSAVPLDAPQLNTLQAELNQISGRQTKMETRVDPGLLGGIVARIGSTVYDGSIRGQLDGLRRKLSAESAESKVGS